jgi:hypothetical protein
VTVIRRQKPGKIKQNFQVCPQNLADGGHPHGRRGREGVVARGREWLFITYVKGTFFGMSESGSGIKEALKQLPYDSIEEPKRNPVEQVTPKHH